MRLFLFAAALAAASPATAQTTVQQDFEAAQAALVAMDYAAARQKFEALLGRLKTPGSRAAGLVKARLGTALVMDGEAEAGIVLLDDALKILSADTEADRSERAVLYADRASAREALGLFGAAADDWRAAIREARVEPATPTDLRLRSSLARSLIWADPEAARRELDSLLEVARQTDESARFRASVLLLRGRVELNGGRFPEALAFFKQATPLVGGTSTIRIDAMDMKVRGDLALAHHLAGHPNEHQRLVAYSGGGSVTAKGLNLARATPLPACGDGTGLAPDDVAVVEFAILDDGSVTGVMPIYAARAAGPDGRTAGAVATPFVQAVREWYWQPASLADTQQFWRQAVRVELRCSKARPDSDLVDASFDDMRTEAYRRMGRSVEVPGTTETARLPQLKAELERRTAAHGADSPELIPSLWALANNGAAAAPEKMGWMARLIPLMAAAKAPPELLALLRVQLAEITAYDAGRPNIVLRNQLTGLLAEEAPLRPTARTTNLIRLRLAEAQEALRQRDEASALLNQVVETPVDALGRADPIRTSALLRLANVAAAQKDLDAAAAALAATGLSPEQCALVDVRPLPENRSVGDIFPREAARWGTGGLTRVEFDIATSGRVENARTVIASPPFVFGEATEAGARKLRFQPVFRPGNTAGCVGARWGFRFQ